MRTEKNLTELQYDNKLNKKESKKSRTKDNKNFPRTLRQTIGDQVRTKRTLQRLSQEQLAELICSNYPDRTFPSATKMNDDGTPVQVTKHAISNQDISNVENGQTNYGIVQLELLSEALEISVLDLFNTSMATSKPKVSENLNDGTHEAVDLINTTLNHHVNNGTISLEDLNHILATINILTNKSSNENNTNSTDEKFYK